MLKAWNWTGAVLIALAVSIYFFRSEGSGFNLLATSAITLSLLFALIALSGRIFFATLAIGYLIANVVLISLVKRSSEKMIAHAYDIYFYFPTFDLIARLWAGHRAFLIAIAALALGFAALIVFSWRGEKPIRRRWIAAALLLPALALSAFATHLKEERRHTQFYWEDFTASLNQMLGLEGCSAFNTCAETSNASYRSNLPLK